jgi:hypothetical protein
VYLMMGVIAVYVEAAACGTLAQQSR